ncbi:GAK5 protein, partial [Illadopsis cleaveri]|nr:GAK5 protein [Illadopsis cleaveri]
MAAAFAAIRGPSRTSGVCSHCGKPGHLKRNCPTLKGEKPKSTVMCSQCHRGQHFSNQCRSKYDTKGHQMQGNQNRSAEGHHAQAQMPQLPQMLPPQMLTPQVP